jgi:copper transport protein
MRPLASALAAAVALLVAGSAVYGPASIPVAAHATLVSSVPGAGQRVDETPPELRLAFTERLEPLGTSADLLDGAGRIVLRSIGDVDAEDPRALVAELPALEAGLYTVAWRALSADDGHTSSGFLTFGVGDVVVPGTTDQTGGGIHAGHSAQHAVADTLARLAGQLGALLAFGLALIALAVVRPLDAGSGRRLGWWSGVALLAAAGGAAVLLPLQASNVGIDVLDYATDSTAGRLLVARTAAGVLAAAIVIGAAVQLREWRWAPLAGVGGLTIIVLLAVSGHATTLGTLAPVFASIVHIASAGVWLAGLVVLAWLAFGGHGARRGLLRAAIPRFSAAALPAVALFGLSGFYLYWLLLRQPLDVATGYGFLLALKVLAGVAAVLIGGLNYLGWRREGIVGERRRVALESALAIGVVAVTAVMVSASPPGATRPITIEKASTSAVSELDASLSLLPGRPGANRVRITLDRPLAAGETLELSLDRVDAAGGAEVELTQAHGGDAVAYGADIPLPPGSSWDATVRRLAGGVEQARARWTFALDDAGLSAGRAVPPISPPAIIALLLAGVAVLGVLLVAAGIVPPRTDRGIARSALLAGAATAAALAALAVLASP